MMNAEWKITPRVRTLTLTALMCAVAIALSFLEGLIPDLPMLLPGMKLGLSNVVVMLSLEMLSLPCGLCVVLFKALFALFMRGGVAAVLSLCGGVLSTLVMYLLLKCKKPFFGYLGVGIAGAFMHNLGQFAAAYLVVSDAVFAYFPVLCGLALLTGGVTGLVNYILMDTLKRVMKNHSD